MKRLPSHLRQHAAEPLPGRPCIGLRCFIDIIIESDGGPHDGDDTAASPIKVFTASQRPAVQFEYGKIGVVKTTIVIPDSLFHQTKAAAALRGKSINDFVTAVLRARLESQGTAAPQERGWRSVFGKASSEAVEEVERILAEELEGVAPDSWR